MKRSKKIALTIIASASIVATGCSKEQKTQREVYQTKEKCVEDWGSDERCEQSPTGTGYIGPHYYRSGSSIFFFPMGSTNPVPLNNTPGAKFANVPAGRTSPNSLGPISSTYKPGSSYSSPGRTTTGVSVSAPSGSHSTTSPGISGATSKGGLGASASSHSSSS